MLAHASMKHKRVGTGFVFACGLLFLILALYCQTVISDTCYLMDAVTRNFDAITFVDSGLPDNLFSLLDPLYSPKAPYLQVFLMVKYNVWSPAVPALFSTFQHFHAVLQNSGCP